MPNATRHEEDAWRELMSPDEREREASFRFDRGRKTYMWARALTRSVLSRYSAAGPSELRFAQGPRGKPELAFPADSKLTFSLAHTDGMVVLLVARDRAVGVDVEGERRFLPSQVPLSLMGADETADLLSLPPRQRPGRFLELWTLRESYAKARGSGIELPLDRCQFKVEGGRVSARFDANLEPAPGRWSFSLLPRICGCVIAVAAALHAPGETRPEVRIFSDPPSED